MFIDSDSFSESDTEDDGVKVNREYTNPSLLEAFDAPLAECLFCDFSHEDADFVVLNHIKCEHNFTISELIRRLGMDEISCLKFVNFVRTKFEKVARHHSLDLYFMDHNRASSEDEKYLQPVKPNDPLLQFCV